MRGGLRSRAEFRPLRVLLIPVALAAASGAIWMLGGTDRYAGPLLVMSLVSAPLMALIAATGRITVAGSMLYARSIRTAGMRDLSQMVDLDKLVSIESVGWRYGRPTRVAPGWAREYLLMQDSTGNRALAWAGGWTRKAELRAILRQAVLDSGCAVDRTTARRLRIRRPG